MSSESAEYTPNEEKVREAWTYFMGGRPRERDAEMDRFLSDVSPSSVASRAVVAAWRDAGKNPVFHKQWIELLVREWPTLAKAVEELSREQEGQR